MLDAIDVTQEVQDKTLRTLKMLRPYDVVGFQKVRIGRAFDGGYVMINNFKNIDGVYSLGINNDVTWDLDIASRGLTIYQYDHTIDALPVEHQNFRWFKKGIGGTSRPDEHLEPLADLLISNGHQKAKNLLLKCDIEGAEWDMLNSISSDALAQFGQIVIETHHWQRLNEPDIGDQIYRAVSRLTEHHRVIHVHANNHAGFAVMGAIALPSVLEFTLIRAQDYDLNVSSSTFPTPLDAPCYPHKPDYVLGSFVY